MRRRYMLVPILAMLALLTACDSLPFLGAAPTEVPFARFTAEDVFGGFLDAGLQVQNVSRDMLVGRDAPSGFSDRYVFEVPHIAPLGGQVLVFDDPSALATWTAYVETLRSRSSTRRDVIYVYPYANVLLQVNAGLLPDEAAAFRDALYALGGEGSAMAGG